MVSFINTIVLDAASTHILINASLGHVALIVKSVIMAYVINDTSHVVLMSYGLAYLMTLMVFVMLFQCNGGSHVQ